MWLSTATGVRGILTDLDISVDHEDKEGMTLSIPAYRRDVARPADVVEEILRIHGYDHIPLPGRMKVSLSDRPKPDPEVLRKEWGRHFGRTRIQRDDAQFTCASQPCHPDCG